MRLHLRSTVMACLTVCFMFGAATADVPNTISFQGRMKDSTGAPYSGSKLVKFAIYDSVGTEIWTSGFTSTTFADGLVTVQLGAPPHPALPTGSWITDTALTLGITVDTDPEISPRIPFTSTGYAFHAGVADELAGFDPSVFVQETGDTMSGSLAIMGDLSVGTDSSWAPVTVNSGSNYSWDVGNGWGDFRIGDDTSGFSIGYAKDGPLAGSARLWSRGGQSEDIWIGNPTFGEVIHIKEIGDVNILGRLGIGPDNLSPLSIQAEDNWTWSIGDGWGDVRIGDSILGFNIGVARGGGGAGATRFWSKGGLVEDVIIGSPTSGNQLLVKGIPDEINLLSDVGIGTETVVAPLTIRSQGQSRWDVGTGLGDFRLDDGSGGLSIGVDTSGNVNLWASGGTTEDLILGSATAGEILRLYGATGMARFVGTSTPFSVGSPGESAGLYYWPALRQMTLQGGSDNQIKAVISATLDYGSMQLDDSNNVNTVYIAGRELGASGGAMWLTRRDGTAGVRLSAGADGDGSELELYDSFGDPLIQMFPEVAGNGSVVLPMNAISRLEMLDEPGISFNSAAPNLSLTPSNTAQDFITVNIFAPTGGYVVLDANVTFRLSGTTLANYAWMQIDTSQAGVMAPRFAWVGAAAQTSLSNAYETASISMAFAVAAGSHTYRVEGNAYSLNDVNAFTAVTQVDLRATFFAGSYGSVNSIVADGSGYPEAREVQVKDVQSGQTRTAYSVDLRHLELQAQRAQMKALDAERAAQRAQLDLQRAQLRDQQKLIRQAGVSGEETSQ